MRISKTVACAIMASALLAQTKLANSRAADGSAGPTVLGMVLAATFDKIDPFTPEQFKLTFAQAATTLMADNLERVGLVVPGGLPGGEARPR